MQHDFVLLDRSGSMGSLWVEALSSINAYVQKLADDKVDTGVTLATFDENAGKFDFTVIRDRITPPTWHKVTDNDAMPRGMTPLNDAIGRIVNLANAGNYDKVAIIIMTDGAENASKELTVDQAKKLLNDCRAKNWQVLFLGADYDNTVQAKSYGTLDANLLRSAKSKLGATMTATASMRSTYGLTGQAMNYSDAQKSELSKD